MSTAKVLHCRVITRFGAELLVETTGREVVRATAKRKFDHVACGDYVTIQPAEQGNARLIALQPRKNALTRPDYSHKLKTIAANIDQLVVILAWRPEPFWELLDRYLVTAHMLQTGALVVMNKADLSAEFASAEGLASLAEYEQIGYTVIQTSVLSFHQQGISELQRELDKKTSVLVGQSGVGKSSLATLLLPQMKIRTGETSASGEGKHTTTATTLYRLPGGGSLIDSPGVRDFALPEMDRLELREGYREFTDLSPYCKFNNCTHEHEPGCRVRDAVERGDIPKRRYKRYLRLLKDIH